MSTWICLLRVSCSGHPLLSDESLGFFTGDQGARVQELVYYCMERFKMAVDLKKPEFLDGNNSLSRLTGWPDKVINPWRLHVPTLTTNSIIIVRYWVMGIDNGKEKVVRALESSEVFRAIGWCDSMWQDNTAMTMNKNTKLLSGPGSPQTNGEPDVAPCR